MISRTKQEHQQQTKHRRKRNKTDFDQLIEKMERDGDYQTNHIELHGRRERRELPRRRPG